MGGWFVVYVGASANLQVLCGRGNCCVALEGGRAGECALISLDGRSLARRGTISYC